MAEALERRYRRLLFAYPADYRVRRGDEIVATLLDLAAPGRRFPSFADAADLISGGLRRRLGTASIAGFEAGLALAAPFALAIAAGISAYAWWRVEPVSAGVYQGGTALFGQFRTLGPIAYLAWLLAAGARAVLRPAAGRFVIGGAILITLLLPALESVTAVDRPPLWVLMALIVFGLLALAGTSVAVGAGAPSADERLAILAGTVAVAVTASTVVVVWPPVGGGFGYYYQPTIARVGTVVAATVATVAVVAVARALRGRPAQSWLWATVLLGLPAGWLGPFDTASLRLAAEAEVPRFGRLAQVLLATCLAVVAMIWLVRRQARAVAPARGGLALAGAWTLGGLIGLTAFVGLGLAELGGFAGPALTAGVPPHATGAALALLVTGVLALGRGPVRWSAIAAGAGAGYLAGWCVAAYDNGWTATGWTDFEHTTVLIATVAFVPLMICAVGALDASAAPTWRRWGVLATSLGWLGYATLPYVLSWGPVLLVLLACCAVLAVTGRRSSDAP